MVAHYQELCASDNMLRSGRVLAAVVKKEGRMMTVVAMGTGTKCIKGVNLDRSGYAVNDCHAEVIARRAFVAYLYSELQKFTSIPEDSIFIRKPCSRLLGLKSDVSFHLYISTVPCGDAAVFPLPASRG